MFPEDTTCLGLDCRVSRPGVVEVGVWLGLAVRWLSKLAVPDRSCFRDVRESHDVLETSHHPGSGSQGSNEAPFMKRTLHHLGVANVTVTVAAVGPLDSPRTASLLAVFELLMREDLDLDLCWILISK